MSIQTTSYSKDAVVSLIAGVLVLNGIFTPWSSPVLNTVWTVAASIVVGASATLAVVKYRGMLPYREPSAEEKRGMMKWRVGSVAAFVVAMLSYLVWRMMQ